MGEEISVQAIEARLDGLTYRLAGERIGVTGQRVHQLVNPPIKIRKILQQRAGNRCENKECGMYIGGRLYIQYHHLTGCGTYCATRYRKGESTPWDETENIKVLCLACHRAVHKRPQHHTKLARKIAKERGYG